MPFPYNTKGAGGDPYICRSKISCREKIYPLLYTTLLPFGISGIVVSVLELVALAFCAIYLRLVTENSAYTTKDMSDAWKKNKDRIQLGYKKFDVSVI